MTAAPHIIIRREFWLGCGDGEHNVGEGQLSKRSLAKWMSFLNRCVEGNFFIESKDYLFSEGKTDDGVSFAEVRMILGAYGNRRLLEWTGEQQHECDELVLGIGRAPCIERTWRWSGEKVEVGRCRFLLPVSSSYECLLGVVCISPEDGVGYLSSCDVDCGDKLVWNTKDVCNVKAGVFAFQGWEVCRDFLGPCLDLYKMDLRNGSYDLENMVFNGPHSDRLVNSVEGAIISFCDTYIFSRQKLGHRDGEYLFVFRYADTEVSGEFGNSKKQLRDFCKFLSICFAKYLQKEGYCNSLVLFIGGDKRNKSVKTALKRRLIASGDGRLFDVPNDFKNLISDLRMKNLLGVHFTGCFDPSIVVRLNRLCNRQQGMEIGYTWVRDCDAD